MRDATDERVNTITADKAGGSMNAPFYCQWQNASEVKNISLPQTVSSTIYIVFRNLFNKFPSTFSTKESCVIKKHLHS